MTHLVYVAGILGWCGLLNTYFWFDPKADLAALFMTQVAPLGDFRVQSTYADFERAVYASR
jgi:methyl acetate hydrolase